MKKAIVLLLSLLIITLAAGGAAAAIVSPDLSTGLELPAQLNIGQQDQPGHSLIITEAQAGAIDSFVDGARAAVITLELPAGSSWARLPDIKVTAGDLELGTAWYEETMLYIPVTTSSSQASVIEISNVAYTADRTLPEGVIQVTIGGNALVQTDFANSNYITQEVAAECVTPAPGQTMHSAEFKVGSNICYAEGAAKVMDTAPYIKAGRTYIPMRSLGEILGAEVVWDDAARTVTLTRGDTTVVFTIGSTTYIVNGVSKTADVAPEISYSCTMLPARFAAEALGASVGWDAASQTVLITY